MNREVILYCLLSMAILYLKKTLNNKENNVFKDGIGVKGLRFKIHGNNHGNHG